MTVRAYKPWPSISRAFAWVAFVSVLVVRLLLAMAPLDPSTVIALSDGLTYLTPMLAVLVLLSIATIRTRGTAEAYLWGMLAPATALLLVAETYWTWYSVTIDSHGPPPSALLYSLQVMALILFLFVVARMTQLGRHATAHRIRIYLEVLGVACVVFPFVYVGWTYPATSDIPGIGNATAVALAIYPIGGVQLMVGAAAILVGWKVNRWRSWEKLAAVSIGIYSLGLISAPVWYPAFLVAEDPGPSWFTAVLASGYSLLGVAVVYRLSARRDEAIEAPWPMPARMGRWDGSWYPVLMALGLPLMGWAAVSADNPEVSRTLLIATALLGLSLVGRAVIADYLRASDLEQDALDRLAWPVSRTEFDGALHDAIARSVECGLPVSVVVFTAHGHPGHDPGLGGSQREQSMTRIATEIRSACPTSGPAFRLCADQFAVLCDGLDVNDAATFARRVWLRSRRESTGAQASLDLYAGVAGYPVHGAVGTSLLTAAQSACQQAVSRETEPVVVHDGLPDVVQPEPQDGVRSAAVRDTVRALAQAVDARSPYTRDHSTNVSELAGALAKVLDLPDTTVHRIGLAALMHDVGKVGLRDELLMKESPLDEDEAAEVRSHVLLGERILTPTNLDEILPAVRNHHERWDGTGYPDGLAGHDIPLEARILAVCDAFESLSSDRPFRAALPLEQAIAELKTESGAGYDPMILAAFVRLIHGLRTPGGNRLQPPERDEGLSPTLIG